MRSRSSQRGFTITEVAIAVSVLSLVVVSSAQALRMNLRTLNGSEGSALATSAVREFREYVFRFSSSELDALNGALFDPPILGNGQPMPDVSNMSLSITVTPVSDSDPSVIVDVDESQTREIRAVVHAYERMILDVKWLSADF